MSGKDYIASPSVIARAGRLGVDLQDVAQISGRTNLALEDVESYVNGTSGLSADNNDNGRERYWNINHAAFGLVSEEPVSRFTHVAAQNLSAANQIIPQVTHHDQADMRAVEKFRAELKSEVMERGIRLTALAFHLKALAKTLVAFPNFNASLSPDGQTLIKKHYCHIGIAVDTVHGLMVPVLRDVDKKGLWQIASETTDLATRARQRKIKPGEMGGASMSVSNLGGIGGTAFTPIVNPPEVAILGLTRTQVCPVWENETWVSVPMTPLDLSYDHRVINGADAARFLAHYARLLCELRRMIG